MDTTRFKNALVGLVVIVWIFTEPFRLAVTYLLGHPISYDQAYTSALTAMANMIVGALIKDMISPQRAHEQKIAEIQATADIVKAVPAAAVAVASGDVPTATAQAVADSIAAAGAAPIDPADVQAAIDSTKKDI